MNISEEILERLMNGEDSDAIAQEFTDAMNAALAEKTRKEAEAEAKREEEKNKNARVQTMTKSINDYIEAKYGAEVAEEYGLRENDVATLIDFYVDTERSLRKIMTKSKGNDVFADFFKMLGF